MLDLSTENFQFNKQNVNLPYQAVIIILHWLDCTWDEQKGAKITISSLNSLFLPYNIRFLCPQATTIFVDRDNKRRPAWYNIVSMTKPGNSKITIKYQGKEYEIEKKKEEQKVKPKGEVSIASTGDKNEITVKNYQEGFGTHSCECNGEKIDIKGVKGRHITIGGGGSILMVSLGFAIGYFGLRTKREK